MTNRFIRIAVIWLLVLATGFVAEPYLVAWRFSAASPRTVTPRAELTEAERITIKLFQAVSPSVVYVFARTKPQELFAPRQEESDVQARTGIMGVLESRSKTWPISQAYSSRLALEMR